jgi:glycosyltransferase involved in cell wall biosynthesis
VPARVSVLIPVRNEAVHLHETVPTILAQELDRRGEIEFLFLEGRSTDDSRAILLRFAARDARMRILDNPSGTIPDALNAGLAHARGEFVARMDAHCRYPRRYLADGIARLRRGDVAWVAGPMVPCADGGASGAIALALRSRLGQGPSRRLSRDGGTATGEHQLDTGVFCGVWRREALLRFGGWEPRWIRNQDSELAARFLAAGERIVSLPSLACDYLPRRSLRELFRQYHGYGRYRTYTAVRHPISRRRSHVFPPGLVIAAPVAALGPSPARTAARAALVAYATAVSVEVARAGREHAAATDVVRLPAAFVAMHTGFGLGVLRGLVACALSPTHGPPA